MAKFSARTSTGNRGPVRTLSETVTFEGGAGSTRDAKSDLFVLAATNMVGEDTFYETAQVRDERFEKLVHAVVTDDPDWVRRFVPFLRNRMNMRSASVVMAAEYLRAGGPNGRQVIASACSRADEPAELVGYWLSKYGRQMPMPFKRGIADAAVRLYNERSLLRYDGQSRGVRFGDVIELCHPKAKDAAQSVVFKIALDRRHNRDESYDVNVTPVLFNDLALRSTPEVDRRSMLSSTALAEAGWSWERLGGWLPGGMDAEAWESVIPSMGYMALLRNLRNFERAGISNETQMDIIARLTDPEQVAKSRQFPYRFLSAYKATDSMTWARALEEATNLSCANLPAFKGNTLVVIDVSGSMDAPVSAKSQMKRWEIGALFAMALQRKCQNVTVIAFGTESAEIEVSPTMSVLRGVDKVRGIVDSGRLGWSTNQHASVAKHYNNHDRVVVFTDEQARDNDRLVRHIPLIHTVNLAGYGVANLKMGSKGRYEHGSFSDATFTLMDVLETTGHGEWPF